MKVEVELDRQGIINLMQSAEMQEALKSEAEAVVARLDGTYETDIYIGKTRANASIKTHDAKTYRRNLKDNELLKALGI